jgi:hypothetical protein
MSSRTAPQQRWGFLFGADGGNLLTPDAEDTKPVRRQWEV